MAESEYLRRLGSLGPLEVKRALRAWDPIGVYSSDSGAPDNEYEGYSATVVALLDRGSKPDLMAYLEKACVEHIEVPFDAGKTEAMVDELMKFWREWKERVQLLGSVHIL
jgi:hypothetical protein